MVIKQRTHFKLKGVGVALMLTQELPVQKDLGKVIDTFKSQGCLPRLGRRGKIQPVPPGSLVEIPQFAAEIGLRREQKLQMSKPRDRLPIGHRRPHIERVPVRTKNPQPLTVIMHVLKNAPALREVNGTVRGLARATGKKRRK